MTSNVDDTGFEAALLDLRAGNFSKLAPCFLPQATLHGATPIQHWFAGGAFAAWPAELAEALTCACFLGATATAAALLAAGQPPAGGQASGMNALHCAASRGQAEIVRLLVRYRVPLELENMHGGTALSQAIWSALHQPMPGQVEAARELLVAGADPTRVALPTGDASLDELLRQFWPR